MKIVPEFVHIIVTILIYEGLRSFVKSSVFETIKEYIFFGCIFLAYTPIFVGLAILGIFLMLLGQFVASIILIFLAFVGFICGISNGFGATWG